MNKRINVRDLKREAFIQLPKWLFTEDRYKELSNDAKVAYALLKDRYRLSEQTTEQGDNRFVDNNGDVYFIFTLDQLQDVLGLSRKTVVKAKNHLIKAGLLEQVRTGQGKANRLYLLEPTFVETIQPQPEPEEPEAAATPQPEEQPQAESQKITTQTVGGVVKCKKGTSKSGEKELQEVYKVSPIKKEFIKTYSSNNSFVNKESSSIHNSINQNQDQKTLTDLCNEYYDEFSLGRWNKKQWNTLVGKYVSEMMNDGRLEGVRNIYGYIRESLKNMAYKYDLKKGRIETKQPHMGWLFE